MSSWIFSAYRKTVTSQPKLYGLIYKKQYDKSLNRLTSLALHRLFYNATEEIIRQLKPDLIVCTHMFPSIVVSRLKRAGLEVPLVTVITDYDAHGTWINSHVNHYLVSTEDVREKLLLKGVEPNSIVVTGMPVHPDFWQPSQPDTIRAELGLKDMPTVLFMGGGWGLFSSEELIYQAAAHKEQVQLILVLGNNDKFREQLELDPRLIHPHIRIMGYTKEIGKLMDVSDLLITKPGGMTCSEGLAKGIPMLFYNPIPGQEEENCQYFVDNGYGEAVTSPATIDQWFKRLTREHAAFRAKRQAFREERTDSRPDVCSRTILELLDEEV